MSNIFDQSLVSVRYDVSPLQSLYLQIASQRHQTNTRNLSPVRVQVTHTNRDDLTTDSPPLTANILEGLFNFGVMGMFNISEFSEQLSEEAADGLSDVSDNVSDEAEDNQGPADYSTLGCLALLGAAVFATNTCPQMRRMFSFN